MRPSENVGSPSCSWRTIVSISPRGSRARAAPGGVLGALAFALLALGAAIYAWCVWDLRRSARSTPAPIDAPKALVVAGLPGHTTPDVRAASSARSPLGGALPFASRPCLRGPRRGLLHTFVLPPRGAGPSAPLRGRVTTPTAVGRRWLLAHDPRYSRNRFSTVAGFAIAAPFTLSSRRRAPPGRDRRRPTFRRSGTATGAIHQAELERVHRRSWHFATHWRAWRAGATAIRDVAASRPSSARRGRRDPRLPQHLPRIAATPACSRPAAGSSPVSLPRWAYRLDAACAGRRAARTIRPSAATLGRSRSRCASGARWSG